MNSGYLLLDKGDIVFIVSRLIVMGAAAFLAILVWSKTRESSWILVILGTISGYVEVLYSALSGFGIISGSANPAENIPWLAILFTNLPWLFFSSAFVVIIFHTKRKFKKS